jgi:hypothetical protein
MPNITLANAKAMAQRYLSNRAGILKTQYSVDILPACETFNKNDITALITQTGCVSFRVYYAMKDDLTICAILTAVDSQGIDILVPGNTIVIEEGQRCPPNCPTNPLSS